MTDEDPPRTHGVLPKPANPTRVELYVPEQDLPWLKQAMAALRRDGSSISAWTLAQLQAWWELHKPGNPQTGLERFDHESAELSAEKPEPFCWYIDETGKSHRIPREELPPPGITLEFWRRVKRLETRARGPDTGMYSPSESGTEGPS